MLANVPEASPDKALVYREWRRAQPAVNRTGAPMMEILMGVALVFAPAGEIKSTLAAYAAAHPHAAIAAATIENGSQAAYFVRGSSMTQGIDDRTRFQIGSITKTFTGTLLAQMVLAGEVKLDDPIQMYLPAGVTAPAYRGTPITLLSLAEQNSGLPRLQPNLDVSPERLSNPYAPYTTAMLYDALNHLTLTRKPGAQYEYSNFGVTLLGQLLANAAHSTYADLLEERVLRPLGMNDTVVVGSASSRVNLVPGFAVDDSPAVPWDFGTLGAAGSIESDLHDMTIYLRANMAAPDGVLGKAMELAQGPHWTYADNGMSNKIGLLWVTSSISGDTWHNGETGGYHADISFNKNAGFGVVLLTNTANMIVDQIAAHILAPARVPAPTLVANGEREPSPYSGVYSLTPTFSVTIFKSNGQLYAQATGQEALELVSRGGQTFAVKGVEATVTFDADSTGKITGLTLHQNGRDMHAAKSP